MTKGKTLEALAAEFEQQALYAMVQADADATRFSAARAKIRSGNWTARAATFYECADIVRRMLKAAEG